MNDLEESLLAAARRAHQPSAEDAARVLRATQRAIAPLPAGGESALGAGSSGGAALGVKLLAGAFAIAALSGALGYQLGMRAGQARDASTARAPIAARAAVAARAAAEPVAAAPLAAAPARVAPPAPAPQERAAPELVRARAPQPRGPHLEPPVTDEPVAPTAATRALPLGSLEAEVRMLERVQRALRDRAPREALALLQQLDREVPEGRLTEERSAARALARCELGQGEPLAHALDFSQRFPASVYFERVRKTCMDAAQREK